MYTLRRPESAPPETTATNDDALKRARLGGALVVAALLYRDENFSRSLDELHIDRPDKLDQVFALLTPEEQAAVAAFAEQVLTWLS